jgi:glycosyltransferase involved in cell wall biosynthesis
MIARAKPATDNLKVVLDTRVVTESGGGPDKTILNSPRFFTGTGYRMLCAYMHPPGDPDFENLRQKAKAWRAPLLSVPDRGPWDWQVVSRLLNICRRERVRIWHGHDYKSNALGLLLRQFWPMHLVTTVHGWVKETRRTPLYYKIDKFCLPYYESVICVSEDLREQCLRHGVAEDRCVLIENAIDIGQFSRRRSIREAKAELGIPAERLAIGAVGRLSPEKGFDLLIRSLRELVKVGLDVELLLTGEGDDKPRLQSLSRELGVSDRIRFLGYRGDPRPIFEAMDLFALSSLREGLPNVLLEAMAMEVPVVATRIAGVPRLVEHMHNGLVIEPGSVAELTRAMGCLLQTDALRTRFARAGRQTIEDRYSFAARIDKIRRIYDRLLGETPAVGWVESSEPTVAAEETGGFRRLHPPYQLR